MKLRFIFLGKKNSSLVDKGIADYRVRLNKYINSECIFIDEKNENKLSQKLFKQIKPRDCVFVLDECGTCFSTLKYAQLIKKKMANYSSIIFVVGSAYGIPQRIIQKAHLVISLSSMTFPHMIARLLLIEQTYRVFCILNNHPYHHE